MQAKPDWTETRTPWGGRTTSPLCGSTQNACQRVYLILLLLCVFAYLTAELPLTVLYLSLPLRKLLQYLWLLCNSVYGFLCECDCVCVFADAGFWQTRHLNELFPVLLQFIQSFFSFVALCSPSQGFITKQVSRCTQIMATVLLSGLADTSSSGLTRWKNTMYFNSDFFGKDVPHYLQFPLHTVSIGIVVFPDNPNIHCFPFSK